MPHAPALRLLVLHGVRLKGLAESDTLASLWAIDEDDVSAELKILGDDGLLQRREGRVTGWQLTGEGRAAHAALLADELDRAGARAAVEDAYRRFMSLNPALLDVCTRWQLRTVDGVQKVNDHADHAYDADVVGRLSALHEQAAPVLASLGAVLSRFGRYPHRLDNALRRVQLGQSAWFTKPLLDSYHTVWFELHEDLLATLGLSRAAEGST